MRKTVPPDTSGVPAYSSQATRIRRQMHRQPFSGLLKCLVSRPQRRNSQRQRGQMRVRRWRKCQCRRDYCNCSDRIFAEISEECSRDLITYIGNDPIRKNVLNTVHTSFWLAVRFDGYKALPSLHIMKNPSALLYSIVSLP